MTTTSPEIILSPHDDLAIDSLRTNYQAHYSAFCRSSFARPRNRSQPASIHGANRASASARSWQHHNRRPMPADAATQAQQEQRHEPVGQECREGSHAAAFPMHKI